VTGLLLVVVLAGSGLAQTVEWFTYDLRLSLRGPRPPHPAIVIVAINDESFEFLNQNVRTWRRAQYAHLIDAIAAARPAAIGMDVAWVQASPEPGDDDALAASLRRAGNVVVSSVMEYQAGAGYAYQRYAPPAPSLAEAAAGVGVVNLPRDNDGVVRRAALAWFHNDAWYPAFAYEVARLYAAQPAGAVLRAGQQDFASRAAPELLVNFCGGAGSFPTLSMYQVLNGEAPAEMLQGKIVLVGFTTALEQDRHAIAFHPPWGSPELMPGVEVHANVVASLLNGDPIRAAPVWLGWTLTLLAAGLSGLAFWRFRPAHALVMVGSGSLFYLAASLLLLAQADLWLPVAAPVGLAMLAAAGGLVERVLVEEWEKRRIRERFQSFMAPERLALVMERWEELLVEDRPEIVASVLFSDIRGFTSATETLTRQGRGGEVIHFLNGYTDAMVEAIFAEHGVLDKLLGDGMLVLFGAPQPAPDHALQAVRAALRMAALLPELNAIWPLLTQRPLRIGIGIHSGVLMDGLLGRGRRVEYTVIGDAVNTAARVQDYTQDVLARCIQQAGDDGRPGATILITGATYALVRAHVRVDADIPPCQAKGKAEPIPVYRVLGLKETEGGAL
jgi:adenylate cyclase